MSLRCPQFGAGDVQSVTAIVARGNWSGETVCGAIGIGSDGSAGIGLSGASHSGATDPARLLAPPPQLAVLLRAAWPTPLGVSRFVPCMLVLLAIAGCAHDLGIRVDGICEKHLPAFRAAPSTAVRLGPAAGCQFMEEFAYRPIFREDETEGPAARQLADKYCTCSHAMAKYDPPIRGFWRTANVDAVTDPRVWKALASSYSQVGPVRTRAGQHLLAWVKNTQDVQALREIAEADIDPKRYRKAACVDYQPYWAVNGGKTAFEAMGIALLARNQIQGVEARLQEEQEVARQREEAKRQAELAQAAKRKAELEANRQKVHSLLGEAAALAKRNNPDKALEAVTEAKRLGAVEDPETASQLREVELAIGNTPALKKWLKSHTAAEAPEREVSSAQKGEAATGEYQHARELVEQELADWVGKDSFPGELVVSLYLEDQITKHAIFVTSEHSVAFQMSVRIADRALREMITMRNLPSRRLAAAKEGLARSGAFLSQATRTEASANRVLETCIDTRKGKERYQSAERGSAGEAIYRRLAKASDECVKPMTEAAVQLRRNIIASFEIKTVLVDLLGWQ